MAKVTTISHSALVTLVLELLEAAGNWDIMWMIVYHDFIRSDSLNSSLTVTRLKRRHNHIQARVSSAKKKSQTELINSIANMRIQIQVQFDIFM